jgi:hypothetical protein
MDSRFPLFIKRFEGVRFCVFASYLDRIIYAISIGAVDLRARQAQ